MLLAMVAIATVGVLTDIPLKTFAVDLLGAYMATLLLEIIHFARAAGHREAASLGSHTENTKRGNELL